MSDKPKHRWYQYSLKTLLVGMTVLCIGPGGYVAYEQAKARRQKAAVEAIEKLDGSFPCPSEKAQPRSAALRTVLGDETFGNVNCVSLNNPQLTDADLVYLSSLAKLKWLSLDHTQLTDAGLINLAGLTKLEFLSLSDTQVTDAGLVHLAGMQSLKYLHLDQTQVTDGGLVHLAGLKQLELLMLADTHVSDAGLATLSDMARLNTLILFRTNVTRAGIDKALPNCPTVRW